jgi:hypothetical protein
VVQTPGEEALLTWGGAEATPLVMAGSRSWDPVELLTLWSFLLDWLPPEPWPFLTLVVSDLESS